jgi:hypothetical protein
MRRFAKRGSPHIYWVNRTFQGFSCLILVSMAVDGVQSEPLSGEFPLTGNKTEKFSAFAPKSPQENPLSHWIYNTYGSLVRSGPVRNRELLISYQGMIIP